MNKQVLWAACTAACALAAPAYAEPLLSQRLEPTLSLNVDFGGIAQQGGLPLHFNAMFDVRSPLREDDADWRRSVRIGEVDLASREVPLFTILQVGASPSGLDLARVLGHNVLAADNRLDETGDAAASTDNRTWIWWVAGAVAVGSVVGLAAHGGGGGGGGGPGPGPDPNPPPGGCLIGIEDLGICLP